MITGTFRLNSDVNFSHNATTKADWTRYIGEQDDWLVYTLMFSVHTNHLRRGRDYAAAHEKMSLLGIDESTLTDCTEILPQPIDLKNLAVGTTSGKGGKTDPTIDPVKLEAAIQLYRSIWL
jgi:hypothetical protein